MKKNITTGRIIRAFSVMAGISMLCISAAAAFADVSLADYTDREYRAMAAKSISLKKVTAENYGKYIKPVMAAYGYNKGECRRAYQPHEEHFYSRYYDHWNVDVVYDRELIEKLYTRFEKSKPVIRSVTRSGSGVRLEWKGVKGSRKYVISVSRDGGRWKKLATVTGKACSYTDKSAATKGAACRYRIQGIKHVRFWDVKTCQSSLR